METYETTEAEALFAQLKFDHLSHSEQRTTIGEAAKKLLAALDSVVTRHLGTPAADGGETSLTWKLPGGYVIDVAIDPTPIRIVAYVKRGDRTGRDRSATLSYNVTTGLLESTKDKPFTAPGARPEKRNALDVVAEAFTAALQNST